MRKIMIVGILALLVVGSIANAFPLMRESKGHIPESIDGLQDSPWPMFCHDAKHTGRSEYDTSMNNGGEKWRYEIEGGVVSSPAIGKDGTIYVGAKTGLTHNLYAIYPDGTLKWKFKTGNWIESSPAIAKDGTIYVGSWDMYLYAVSLDGTLKWRFNCHSPIESSPAIGSDGAVYIGVVGPGWDKGRVCAINPNGTEKWHFDTGWWIYSSPAIGDDGTIYIGSNDCYLYAINPDGTEKWKFKTGDCVQSSPTIDEDGTIYVGSWDSKLYAVNPDGTEKWSFKTGGAIDDSSPAIGKDGTIYVGSYDGKLYAVNPDGTKKWSFKTGNSIISSPALSRNGIIYIGSMDGKLYSINPDGTERWSIKMLSNEEYDVYYVESSPAIGKDGTVYVGSWFVSEKPSWGYLHAIKDGMAKGIEIIRPKQDYLYILDREITKLKYTTIIGKITVEVSILSEENVDKVEFYVDYKYKYTDYSPPFEWAWNERIIGRSLKYIFEYHGISAKAYYNDGDVVASHIKHIKIFNPFGKSLDIASALPN